jgi:hypothetical protein
MLTWGLVAWAMNPHAQLPNPSIPTTKLIKRSLISFQCDVF